MTNYQKFFYDKMLNLLKKTTLNTAQKHEILNQLHMKVAVDSLPAIKINLT
jgi:hypothetical protein